MGQRMQWRSLGGDGPRLFERIMVPALFRSWAIDLLSRAAPTPGDRVLDLACGTGIVARLAAERVGATAHVVGLDISTGMLAVARANSSGLSVEWREGSADALPFPDGAFDLVLCQQGLQYFPDRAAALAEMRRVLAGGGRLAASVFCASPVHEALADALSAHVGAEVAAMLREPISFADPTMLRALVATAGFSEIAVERVAKLASFGSPADFLAYNVATRLAAPVAVLSEAAYAALLEDATGALAPWTVDGELRMPMEAHVVTARV